MQLPALFTAVCVASLIALVLSERIGSRRGRYVSKPLASAAFIVTAIALGTADASSYGTWILVGLVLGAAGDVALMFEGERAFLAGLGSFLLGHVAYVIAFAAVTPLAAWATPLTLVPLAGAGAVTYWLWPHLGKMRIPVLCYVTVITLMAIGALSAQTDARALLDATHARLLTAGALLFFASDVAVAREKFVAGGWLNRAWGLPAYYGGQLLLAWSAAR